MQELLTYAMLLITGLVMQAQSTVEVAITNFDSNDGKALIALYNEEAHFLNKSFMAVTSEIENNEATASFKDVPNGVYAISMFHDEDGDGKMKMTMGMIPAEDYGCSNNAKGFFGPPKWKDAKFEVVDGEVKKVQIKL